MLTKGSCRRRRRQWATLNPITFEFSCSRSLLIGFYLALVSTLQELTDAYKRELEAAEAAVGDADIGPFPAQELLAAMGAALDVCISAFLHSENVSQTLQTSLLTLRSQTAGQAHQSPSARWTACLHPWQRSALCVTSCVPPLKWTVCDC